MSYFIYNDIRSNVYGILENCPPAPTSEQDTENISIPNRTERLTEHKTSFKDININVTIGVKDKKILRDLYVWLVNEGTLILSEDTSKKYNVKHVKISPEYLSKNYCKVDVTFTCSPFAYAVRNDKISLLNYTSYTEIINNGSMWSEPIIEFKVHYEPSPILKGDVDFNGVVDASDASLVLAEYARTQAGGQPTFTPEQFEAADMDNNGKIDATDAAMILEVYRGNQTSGTKPTFYDVFIYVNTQDGLKISVPSECVLNGYTVTINKHSNIIYYTDKDGNKVNIMHYTSGDLPKLKSGTNYVKYIGDLEEITMIMNERWK